MITHVGVALTLGLLIIWKASPVNLQSISMPAIWVFLVVLYALCSAEISSSKRDVFISQYLKDKSDVKQKLRYGYLGRSFDTVIAVIFTLVFLVKIATMSAYLIIFSYLLIFILVLLMTEFKDVVDRHVKPEYTDIVTTRISSAMFSVIASFSLVTLFLLSSHRDFHGLSIASILDESVGQIHVDSGFTLMVSIAVTIEYLQIWFVQNVFSGMIDYGVTEIALLILMFSTYYIYSYVLIRIFYGARIAQYALIMWRGNK